MCFVLLNGNPPPEIVTDIGIDKLALFFLLRWYRQATIVSVVLYPVYVCLNLPQNNVTIRLKYNKYKYRVYYIS